MKLVIAIIKPFKMDDGVRPVRIGVQGVTVTEVKALVDSAPHRAVSWRRMRYRLSTQAQTGDCSA